LGISADYLLRGNPNEEAGANPEAAQLLKAYAGLTHRDRELVIEIVKSFSRATSLQQISDPDDTLP